jgi:accessory gene regulator protein AgrB
MVLKIISEHHLSKFSKLSMMVLSVTALWFMEFSKQFLMVEITISLASISTLTFKLKLEPMNNTKTTISGLVWPY